MLSRVPLRLRLTLAFTLASALALGLLGTFVAVTVTRSLEERLHDIVGSELESLLAEPPADRAAIVRQSTGEVFMQLRQGSRLTRAPSLRTTITAPKGFSNRTVRLADDEGVEAEYSLIYVRQIDGQEIAVGTTRDDTDAAAASVRRQLLIGIPSALLLAAGLGYLIAGAGLRPIERMREHASVISSRRSSARLPLPAAHDELYRLGVTLNEMLDRLDAGLIRERRFVAEASHELRTPLALLRTEIDLALAQQRSAAELEAALRSASEETERLIALANGLLDVASTDSDHLSLECTAVDLGSLVSSVAERFRPALDAERRELSFACPERIVVEADRLRLEQAVSNLIDNAVRHGSGRVGVVVHRAGDGAVIEIVDAGPGIEPELLARAIEPFAHGRTSAGAGLGLAIVRAIVDAHGGEVTLANVDGQGSGTRVRVSLPTGDQPRR
jgi:signal transduction histidine kinase